MMKKTFKIIAAFLCVFTLCGCSAREAIASDKSEYLVSAMGFDNYNGNLKFFLESVIVNSDDLKEEKQNKIISIVADNTDEAFQKIKSKITQPLSLSHTAVMILGENLSKEQLKDIFKFCYNQDEINLAAMFVATQSVEDLLSVKPVSSVAVGYDIMSMVEVVSEETGNEFQNRFYQIELQKSKPLKIYKIPKIGQTEQELFFDEVCVFKDFKIFDNLSLEEELLSSFITDNITTAEMVLNKEKIKIKSSKTTYKFRFNNNLKIILNIKSDVDGDKEIIKKEIEDLFERKQKIGKDIFGIGNIICHNSPRIWRKIKGNYKAYFKDAVLKVNING